MIAGIVLAAGLSSRMGQPKQLLDWGGIPLVRHVVLQALGSQLDHVLVVINALIPPLAEALSDLAVQLVPQPDPAAGQGASLSLGIAALPQEVSGAMIILGDQPFVAASLLDDLLAAAQTTEQTIIAPLIAGRRANPVLFKAAWFPHLRQLQGDEGARQLLVKNQDQVLLIPVEQSAANEDLDTPADYARLRPG